MKLKTKLNIVGFLFGVYTGTALYIMCCVGEIWGTADIKAPIIALSLAVGVVVISGSMNYLFMLDYRNHIEQKIKENEI